MKKIIIIAMFMTLAFNASAQLFDFSNNRDRFGVGFHIGNAGRNAEYQDLGFGVSINVMGVYLDMIQAGPEHKYDNHVTNTLYNDSVAFITNIGYQVPVLPWLRLMPMVGYCQTNAGLTDATTVNVDVDEDHSARIYHDYDVIKGTRKHHFNFGCGIFIQPFSWLEIYAIGSHHGIYGGLSFNLSSLVDY